jgi:hypothetical protein
MDGILKYVAQADEVWHAGDIGDLSVRQLDENKTHKGSLGILMISASRIPAAQSFHV